MVSINELLPALRAALALKLLDMGMSQQEIALKLGVSQPAISQYKRSLRAKQELVQNIITQQEITKLAHLIATSNISKKAVNLELLNICQMLLGEFEL